MTKMKTRHQARWPATLRTACCDRMIAMDIQFIVLCMKHLRQSKAVRIMTARIMDCIIKAAYRDLKVDKKKQK